MNYEDCIQSDDEVKKFFFDFTSVNYEHIVRMLSQIPQSSQEDLEMFLSQKQRRFLSLSTIEKDQFDKINCKYGVSQERVRAYRQNVAIHGSSQNRTAQIGAMGAIIAVYDALYEIDSNCIKDNYGERIPGSSTTPSQLYEYLDKVKDLPKSILLKNGRTIAFTSDPDIAIFQSLDVRYKTAEDAYNAWGKVRKKISERAKLVHIFAVGDIKTATDVTNLHERIALGCKEIGVEDRADRFLMMANLNREVIMPPEKGRRASSLVDHDIPRFNNIFNLYFAWGYDDARLKHSQHWNRFKTAILQWCGLEN